MNENVVVLIDDIYSIKNEEEFANVFASLPKYRQDKIMSFKNENDQYLSLLAGKLLHEGLIKIDRAGIDELVVTDSNGKQFIPGNPVYFSISHSGTKVMVIISNSEVGCDIQVMKPEFLSLADRYFTDDECKLISNSANPVETFYRLWTLKESYMKVTGKGLSFGLKNIIIENESIKNEDCVCHTRIVDGNYVASYVITNKKINLIFDCDGTLIDSYESICDRIYRIFKKFNVETDMNEIRQLCIYNNVGHCIETLSNRYSLIPNAVKAEYKTDTDNIEMMKLYGGVKELFNDSRFNCFVYTHRGESTASIFTKFGIKDCFTEVVSVLNGFKYKPSSEAIDYLVNKYNLDKNNTYYVGDRIIDIQCGNNAGIKTIFFNSSGLEIDHSEASFVVDNLIDIQKINF